MPPGICHVDREVAELEAGGDGGRRRGIPSRRGRPWSSRGRGALPRGGSPRGGRDLRQAVARRRASASQASACSRRVASFCASGGLEEPRVVLEPLLELGDPSRDIARRRASGRRRVGRRSPSGAPGILLGRAGILAPARRCRPWPSRTSPRPPGRPWPSDRRPRPCRARGSPWPSPGSASGAARRRPGADERGIEPGDLAAGDPDEPGPDRHAECDRQDDERSPGRVQPITVTAGRPPQRRHEERPDEVVRLEEPGQPELDQRDELLLGLPGSARGIPG